MSRALYTLVLYLSSDVKECSNLTINCTTEKHCTETLGGYECTCANMSLYGENCTKREFLLFYCTYFAAYYPLNKYCNACANAFI